MSTETAVNAAMASADALSNATGLVATIVNAPNIAAVPGGISSFLLFMFKLLPGSLYWLITFASMTLPTWLFTLFSTSLTFTMNATTLYVQNLLT